MANEDHIKVLHQGCNLWNAWRTKEPLVEPDLSGANLSEADLRGANLSEADLRGACEFQLGAPSNDGPPRGRPPLR
jgi:uncharacterized protein YjbI with pentapeptide repeats